MGRHNGERPQRLHPSPSAENPLSKVSGAVGLGELARIPHWTSVACCGERFFRDPMTGKLHPTAGDPSSPVHAHQGIEVVLALGASPGRLR